ncbi:hypothetical protein GOODEAATRI_026487, partial [Goodea atripinnis]
GQGCCSSGFLTFGPQSKSPRRTSNSSCHGSPLGGRRRDQLSCPVLYVNIVFTLFGYLVVLQSRLLSRRLVRMFQVCRRSDTLCPSAVAGRCSGSACSGRDAPLPGTPPSLASDRVFLTLHSEPLSPVHTEDEAGGQVHRPQMFLTIRGNDY